MHRRGHRQICYSHINTIESTLKHAKAHFKRTDGTKIEQFDGHLCEIMWRWWHKESKVTGILNLIQEFSPLDRNPIMTACHEVFRTWFQHQQASANNLISQFDSSDNEQATANEISQQADEPGSQQLELSADVFHDQEQLTSEQEAADTGKIPITTTVTMANVCKNSTSQWYQYLCKLCSTPLINCDNYSFGGCSIVGYRETKALWRKESTMSAERFNSSGSSGHTIPRKRLGI